MSSINESSEPACVPPLKERAKPALSLAAIFLSGVLVAIGLGAVYHRHVVNQVNEGWVTVVQRLEYELDNEKTITRFELQRLAKATDSNSDAIGELLAIAQKATTQAAGASRTAQEAAEAARGAASTARAAATTAKGAAANAARANIGKREFPTRDGKK